MIGSGGIAIVGASGLVGQELGSILLERGVRADRLKLFARRRSTIIVGGVEFEVLPLDLEDIRRCDLAFLVATSTVARELAPLLIEANVLTIDNSSAFRMDRSVPLIIPEVNPETASGLLIANPNCSTILLLTAVAPLHRAFRCRSVDVCTYQAVSGAGRDAVSRLRADTALYLQSAAAQTDPADQGGGFMAFNVWSHESPIDPETGMNGEEEKIVRESRKILGSDLRVSATCIRVPVERAHGEAVTIEFEQPVRESEVRHALEQAPGIRVVDDRVRGHAPTAREATGSDEVLVGRIRPDPSTTDGNGAARRFHLWLTGDQLRKGAALNAVQIAELPGIVPTRAANDQDPAPQRYHGVR